MPAEIAQACLIPPLRLSGSGLAGDIYQARGCTVVWSRVTKSAVGVGVVFQQLALLRDRRRARF